MKKKDFKIDDWVFCEFELSQIKEMNGNRITSITTGQISMSGYDLSDRCFPLALEFKVASDTASYWSKKIHELKNAGLNHPDIHRELVSRWVDICESANSPNVKDYYEKLSAFGRGICEKVESFKYEDFEGVRLFR
jgi:hypothetical protein